MLFKNLNSKILKYIQSREKSTLEEITLAVDASKTKVMQALSRLVNKGEVEQEGNDYSIPKIELPKETSKIGLSEQMQELNDKLDLIANTKKQGDKKFRLKGFSQKKLKRYNKGKYRAVLILRRNAAVELLRGEFVQGMIKVGENYYDASAMYTWLFKRLNKLIPFYIIPEWDIRPICREEIYKKAKQENTLIDSQVITLRAMKLEQVGKQEGKKMGGMMWIGLAIGAIVIIYLIFSGKK